MDTMVTVLMPAFNRENTISRALYSIQMQTYRNFKILVYDDGSTDSTLSVLDGLLACDNRISYIHGGKNKGVAKSRNILLNECSTQYAMWMDSDDVANIYRLELLLNEMLINPNHVINSCFDKIPENDSYWKQKPLLVTDEWQFADRGGGATCFFEVAKAIEYDESLAWGEDSLWRDTMNNKYGKETLIKRVLYYVDFTSENRLGRKNTGRGYWSGRGFTDDN